MSMLIMSAKVATYAFDEGHAAFDAELVAVSNQGGDRRVSMDISLSDYQEEHDIG